MALHPECCGAARCERLHVGLIRSVGLIPNTQIGCNSAQRVSNTKSTGRIVGHEASQLTEARNNALIEKMIEVNSTKEDYTKRSHLKNLEGKYMSAAQEY